MSTLDFLAAKLQENPHTYAHDISAVDVFISQLTPEFSEIRGSVFISTAVIELTNESGYPVGHLTWDADNEAFIFIPAGIAFDEVS